MISKVQLCNGYEDLEELGSRLQGSLLRSDWLLSAVSDSLEETTRLGNNLVQDSISKNVVPSANNSGPKC